MLARFFTHHNHHSDPSITIINIQRFITMVNLRNTWQFCGTLSKAGCWIVNKTNVQFQLHNSRIVTHMLQLSQVISVLEVYTEIVLFFSDEIQKLNKCKHWYNILNIIVTTTNNLAVEWTSCLWYHLTNVAFQINNTTGGLIIAWEFILHKLLWLL